MTDDKVFVTKDIYLAAALHSLDIEYLGVDKSDMAHQKFSFIGKDINELETQWINGTLIGNLSKYGESFRKMKSIIHSND